MKTEKTNRKKFMSISYCASSLIFLLTIISMSMSLINKWSPIASSLESIINISDFQVNTAILYLIIIMFFPSFIYLIKLNFSLIAFESNDRIHTKYVKRLNKISLIAENSLRLLIFIFLLLFMADMHLIIINIGESIFPFDIQFYGHFEDSTNYFPIYKGFPFLKDIMIFYYTFFILLLFWDLVVYLGNLISDNRISLREFFEQFIKQHLFGLLVWIMFSYLILTYSGHKLLHNMYIYVIITLTLLSLTYLIIVVKSFKNILSEFKQSFYLTHG